VKGSSMLQLDFTPRKDQALSRFYSAQSSTMWQLYFTQWKAQVCENYILLIERLKYVTIRFYFVKGSSMWQLNLTPWKAQVFDN
jgi:hypothetical protein